MCCASALLLLPRGQGGALHTRVVATGGYDGKLCVWDIDHAPAARDKEGEAEAAEEHELFQRMALLRSVGALGTAGEDERRALD